MLDKRQITLLYTINALYLKKKDRTRKSQIDVGPLINSFFTRYTFTSLEI